MPRYRRRGFPFCRRSPHAEASDVHFHGIVYHVGNQTAGENYSGVWEGVPSESRVSAPIQGRWISHTLNVQEEKRLGRMGKDFLVLGRGAIVLNMVKP